MHVIDGYCTLGMERETCLSAGELLRTMDSLRITQALIAPEDHELAVNNIEGNDRILSLAETYKGRFIPACGVNPWFGRAGCRELRRAVGRGARMLIFAPALQGFCPCDEIAADLLDVAAELQIPVYVHTGAHSYGAPTQVVLAARRHRDTRFIVGHCGSTDYSHDMGAVLAADCDNLWYELSLVRPWSVARYLAMADRSKFIFGSNAPRQNIVYEFRQLEFVLPVSQNPDVYGVNLRRLLEPIPKPGLGPSVQAPVPVLGKAF